MPRVDELVEPQELRRCIRDLVALSTLPAIWRDFNARQIADSAAAALLAMFQADVVYVSVPGGRDEPVAGVMRTSQATSSGPPGHIENILRAASHGRREQTSAIENPLGKGTLRIVAVPMGFGSDAGIIAGSVDPQFPSETDRLLLGIAANHATLAIQRWRSAADQRRLATVIERSSEFIGFADLSGTPQYINKAASDLLGLSGIDDALRLTIFDFMAPGERARARHELFPKVMESGRWLGEINFRHFVSGEIIPFWVDWFRIDDARTGRPTNMATVSRDLRPQKKLEGDLRRLNGSLEQRVAERTAELGEALERLTLEAEERLSADVRAQQLQAELHHASRLSVAGQMAGALAHELSQPLTAFTNSINAANRMVANGSSAAHWDAVIREVLGEASEQALRAGEIIRRLREFVTRGETEMQIQNLSDLIREASHFASAGAGTHGVQIRLSFDRHADAVFANRIQLQQVMVNLIRNAYEAMALTEWHELDVITARRDDKSIEITVADRGSGVPDSIVEHLFEPFHTTKIDGMGLGLSICRSIVEAHCGKLKYEPNRGGGAIFRVTLPVPTMP